MTTDCIGVSWEGTEVLTILGGRRGFSEMTVWAGGEGILISLTVCRACGFSVTTFCVGGEGIGMVTIFCTGAA